MLNHAFQTFTTSMPRRVNQLLLLAIALLGTGMTIAAFSHGVVATNARVSARSTVSIPLAAAPQKLASAPTLLPTVVVTTASVPTTLATITVRPNRTTAAAQKWERVDDFTLGAIDNAHATVALPSGGLAMPYYSFSRSPRHSNKE